MYVENLFFLKTNILSTFLFFFLEKTIIFKLTNSIYDLCVLYICVILEFACRLFTYYKQGHTCGLGPPPTIPLKLKSFYILYILL